MVLNARLLGLGLGLIGVGLGGLEDEVPISKMNVCINYAHIFKHLTFK